EEYHPMDCRVRGCTGPQESKTLHRGRPMPINVWWKDQPEERYWLETTDRTDLGANLRAPQKDDGGAENASYVLVTHVQDGDIVLHYPREEGAIAGWSRAVGGFWQSTILWASHAGEPKSPRERLGWQHGLDGPFRLSSPITLQQLREAQPRIASVQDA